MGGVTGEAAGEFHAGLLLNAGRWMGAPLALARRFCIFGNAAIAARYAQRAHGLKKGALRAGAQGIWAARVRRRAAALACPHRTVGPLLTRSTLHPSPPSCSADLRL